MMFVGRITKDAEVKKLKDEREVVTFSIAVNDYYKPKGTEQGVQATTFYNCSYWISSKIAPRLTKGSLVEIVGRVYVNAYTSLMVRLKHHLIAMSIASPFISRLKLMQRTRKRKRK